MAEVTVKQLADTVGAPVDRLLKQMQQAGLSHKAEDEAVSEQETNVACLFERQPWRSV